MYLGMKTYLYLSSVRCNGKTIVAGYLPKEQSTLSSRTPKIYTKLVQASNESAVCTIAHLQSKPDADSKPQATINHAGVIHQYSSLRDVVSGTQQAQPLAGIPNCTQLVAYDTGFAALTATGNVYTWGDERYGACLGRDISEENPAGEPGLVTALQDLPTGPIAKIAAGGYMLAALTTGNDLYLWGGHPGRKTVPEDVTDEPAPVVVEEADIADVAVGEAHLLVLTTDGKVLVIGDNGSGQLGLPIKSTDSWRQVELRLREGRRAVAVVAGPRNSFVIIKTE